MYLTIKSIKEMELEQLVEIRMQVLKEVNDCVIEKEYKRIKNECYQYYKHALKNEEYVGFYLFYEDEFVACGGASLYKILPSYENQGGWNAQITNLYTAEQYRRKGVAKLVLGLIIEKLKRQGIKKITLEASEVMKELYIKKGFDYLMNAMCYVGEESIAISQ